MTTADVAVDRVREAILGSYEAALSAVAPERTTATALGRLSVPGPVTVIAIGKAAAAMARGAVAVLERAPAEVLIVSDHVEPVPDGARLLVGSHPFPDDRSVVAGRAALYASRTADPDGTVVFLLSGGGSSLAEVPPIGLTVADVARTAQLAMDAGMPITALNAVRRQLSSIKNGQLLAATAAKRAITLAVSDVGNAPSSVIASGPTITDGSAPADAIAALEDHGLLGEVPVAVVDYLRSAAAAGEADIDHHVQVIADGRLAAEAAVDHLGEMSHPARLIGQDLEGYAIASARSLCSALSSTIAVVSGETTMRVTGTGRGGRNQSAALAAAVVLDDGGPAVFAALASDGIDGPTDAAGAIVDHRTVGAIRRAGLDPRRHLGDDDAYPALAAADALVVTGPSGTNVGDLWFGWRDSG